MPLLPASEADQDAAQLVHAVDGSAGVVHGRGDRPGRDIDDLQDAELDVVLERPRRAEVDGRAQFGASVGGQPLPL